MASVADPKRIKATNAVYKIILLLMVHLPISCWDFYSYCRAFGVITRLRVGLASLRDSPKPRLDIIFAFLVLARVPVIGPEAKLKGGCEAEGAFTGTH